MSCRESVSCMVSAQQEKRDVEQRMITPLYHTDGHMGVAACYSVCALVVRPVADPPHRPLQIQATPAYKVS